MPRIPVYEQQTVAPNQLPDVQQSAAGASPGAFGANQGAQLQQIGDIIQKRAEQLQRKEDEDLVNQAVVAFEDDQRKFLNDPDAGLLQKRGGNALGASTTASKWFDDAAPRYNKNLKTDRQRALFDQQYQRSRLSAMQVVSRFEAQERKASYISSANARAASAIEQASLYYQQPDVVARSKEDMAAAVEAVAQSEGYTPEIKQQAMLDATSTFHQRQIDARIEADPGEAKKYYLQNKEEISARDRAAIESRLETSNLRAQGQYQSDNILRMGLSEGDALARAREIKDHELRDEVTRRVELRYADDRRILKQNQDQALEKAYNLFLGGTSVSKMPERLWSSLDMQGKQALINLERSGGEVKTDVKAWYELEQLRTEDPEAFKNLNLTTYADRISTTDLKSLMTEQSKAPDQQEIDSLKTKTDMVKQAMTSVGLDYGDLTKDGAAGDNSRSFQQYIDAQYQQFQTEKKRKPSGAELQQILDQATIKVVKEKKFWFNESIRFDQLRQEDLGDVPVQLADELAAALQSTGEEVTVKNIQKLYQQLQDAGAFQ